MLCGGDTPEGLPADLAKGHYYAPTVIGDVHPKMHIVQEEVFGPVVVVYGFDTEVCCSAKLFLWRGLEYPMLPVPGGSHSIGQ